MPRGFSSAFPHAIDYRRQSTAIGCAFLLHRRITARPLSITHDGPLRTNGDSSYRKAGAR
jgi:hypothetical protein